MEGLNPGLLARVLYQMQTESGGNPNIFNTTDINAQRGTPSGGLMQVIGPTFRAYHWPGTSWNLLDPLANIAAALNYARHRYGPSLMSGGMGIGSGHGYALGTASAAAGWAWVGERGPELVRFRGGEQVRPAGGGNTYNITVNVPPTASKADTGRVIVEHIREYERGSGTRWRK
jgi:SLT domain-containing protein